jgi:hypothetical protein
VRREARTGQLVSSLAVVVCSAVRRRKEAGWSFVLSSWPLVGEAPGCCCAGLVSGGVLVFVDESDEYVDAFDVLRRPLPLPSVSVGARRD